MEHSRKAAERRAQTMRVAERRAFEGYLRWGRADDPRQSGVLLAALGLFQQAETVLIEPLAQLELRAKEQLERGQALLAKRANSRIGKLDVEYGESDRSLADDLPQLLNFVRARDGVAIASLLRDWDGKT